MSGDVVIRAEGLGKKYLIGQRTERERYVALRDVLARSAQGLKRKVGHLARGQVGTGGDTLEEFWALKDVSFEVKRGEVLGIIGRNGAGKSTLLKILSRITEPTAGRVTIKGRVASLLEVGTGFHPELTGRENIYLNGAILGMSRAEIRKKFDEIVTFAEVEKFLDTPVKRYSSGMYVRLAFAVAAHLEPEILVVDEVLAVGDAEFQRKCLGKMSDVSRHDGRAVLLVSHNMAAVAQLAQRAILLRSGSVALAASASECISGYLKADSDQPVYHRTLNNEERHPYIARVQVITSDQNAIHQYGRPLEIKIWVCHLEPLNRPCFSVQLINQLQQPVVHAFAYHPDISFGNESGVSCLTCRFPNPKLNVGHYYVRAHLSEPPGGQHYETLNDVCRFEVVRHDRNVLWGWRTDACVYHEECDWRVAKVKDGAASSR